MNSLNVTEGYGEAFERADNTFLYQIVYNPRLRRLQPLTPYPDDLDPSSLNYAGRLVGVWVPSAYVALSCQVIKSASDTLQWILDRLI